MKFILLILAAITRANGLSNSTFQCRDLRTDDCRIGIIYNAAKSSCQRPTTDKNNLVRFNTHLSFISYEGCATYDEEMHSTSIGICPYDTQTVHLAEKASIYFRSADKNRKLTTIMCDPLNRTGLLCSLCKQGLGPAVLNYSYPCLECTHNVIVWLASLLLCDTDTSYRVSHNDIDLSH